MVLATALPRDTPGPDFDRLWVTNPGIARHISSHIQGRVAPTYDFMAITYGQLVPAIAIKT